LTVYHIDAIFKKAQQYKEIRMVARAATEYSPEEILERKALVEQLVNHAELVYHHGAQEKHRQSLLLLSTEELKRMVAHLEGKKATAA
jgi:redox-regulated HSP33 family molecular chaperone